MACICALDLPFQWIKTFKYNHRNLINHITVGKRPERSPRNQELVKRVAFIFLILFFSKAWR